MPCSYEKGKKELRECSFRKYLLYCLAHFIRIGQAAGGVVKHYRYIGLIRSTSQYKMTRVNNATPKNSGRKTWK